MIPPVYQHVPYRIPKKYLLGFFGHIYTTFLYIPSVEYLIRYLMKYPREYPTVSLTLVQNVGQVADRLGLRGE